MNRYLVTMDYYIYAKDETEAIKKALEREVQEKKKHDNQCSILDVRYSPFGKLATESILK